MAETAHKSKAAAKEYFDPIEVREAKVKLLAKWIRESDHFTAFTGAGISTSTGIPDFRSGMDTVLETGPGVWELRAKKQARSARAKTTSTLKAIPSVTHMALVQLEREGHLKFLVSQNTDGLHLRSGFPPEKIAEVHGNSNKETCRACGQVYLRDFRCRVARGSKKHATGRMCQMPGCKGKLYDSIINFGENLPEREINLGFAHTAESDVCLCLGSSLTVTPAADMPEQVGNRKGRHLVIVNLQRTPLDHKADLVIHAKCDDVMSQLARELRMEVPEFRLRRYVKVSRTSRRSDASVTVQGVNVDGTPYSLFKRVVFMKKGGEVVREVDTEPHRATMPAKAGISVRLVFPGHYREPDLTMPVSDAAGETTYMLTFNPRTGVWESVEPHDADGAADGAGPSSESRVAGGAGGAGGSDGGAATDGAASTDAAAETGVAEVTKAMESLGS
mmetsp:Transcript_9984/g.34990  ORF Transcript_9984/g.34990 Transcript_9984/m.34990 type:complete len:447 (-) Transcript_9984:173-1513(-)|eukprot:CAMPEP_0203816824 /NCGR_PEP_ID=MMETSP0115-20131106/18176_1 /ASSEMBLY_ACC=CAM_ASM_000227 /TAXON_ID=33651 /ORGANISM="Bicosoecid sp, Strain ms1" /LENGTH=446 /DNA_ID=CAMNT_0050725735 /DNA_START=144 /DNA_END=1484 /DNA_ORIENTATION=+